MTYILIVFKTQKSIFVITISSVQWPTITHQTNAAVIWPPFILLQQSQNCACVTRFGVWDFDTARMLRASLVPQTSSSPSTAPPSSFTAVSGTVTRIANTTRFPRPTRISGRPRSPAIRSGTRRFGGSWRPRGGSSSSSGSAN